MPTIKTGRITETIIRKAIQKEQFDLTDEDIFTSRAFSRIVTAIGKVLTGRVKQPVSTRIIWEPDNDSVAHTDNLEIVVNAAHSQVQKLPTRYERYCFILGSIFHEFGHCAYTDFEMRGDYIENIMNGRITMMPSITPNNKSGFDKIAAIQKNGEKARYVVMMIFRNFDNLFEDVFVDFWTSHDYPGNYSHCLAMLNQVMYGKKISDFMERQKDKFGDDRVSMWSLYCASLISFLLLGQVNYGDLSDNRLVEIKSRIDKIDRDIHSDINDSYHIRRKMRQNDMLAINWDLVMHDIESGTLMIDDPLQKNINMPSNQKLSEKEKSELEKALENMLGQKASNHDDPDRVGNMKMKAPAPAKKDGSDKDDKTSSPLLVGEKLSEEFHKLVKALAEEKAESMIEVEHQGLLEESAAKSLSYYDDIAGTKISVNREKNHDSIKERQYNAIWPTLAPVSASLQKKLLKYLEALGEEETMHGLINGKHLHSGGLHRRDGQFFKKRLEPSGSPKIVVVILADHSYSMKMEAKARGELNMFRNKVTAVAYASLILYDFCISLGIPVMVVGHYAKESKIGTNTYTVTLNVYASFERLDINDRYRILDTTVHGGNRDGTALQFCVHELAKRPEDIKLLFTLSDGDPSAYPSKEEGVDHIKQILREAKRNLIRVFSAALDEDIEEIKDIFNPDTGAKCYEMTDLARLPVELLRIIKRYLV